MMSIYGTYHVVALLVISVVGVLAHCLIDHDALGVLLAVALVRRVALLVVHLQIRSYLLVDVAVIS